MILGVHHIGLKVADISSLRWLDHVGGGPRGAWATCPNVHVRLINADISPLNPVQARPVNLPGIAHICLQSRDIEDGLAHGVNAGLVAISGPVDLGTPFRYLYAHTSDGVLLELEGAPFVRDANPRFWVGHVAYVAKDIEPLVAFYGHVLGLAPSPVSRLRANPRIDQVAGLSHVDLSAMWISGLNLGLEFWQYHHPSAPLDTPHIPTGFTYVCFESNDLANDTAHIVSQGGLQMPPESSSLPNSQSASFMDPEGNRFDLIAFDNPSDSMAIANLPNKDILEVVSAQRPTARSA